MKFTIPHDKVWFRPDKAYFESQSRSQGIDSIEIEWNGKYKSIRELRGLAIFGLCLYEIYGTPFFVQMNSKDSSPDAFIMRVSPDDSTTNEIGPVEITFYGRSRVGLPKQALANKLSAKGGKFWKLPPEYCLLIHIGRGLRVNHKEVSARLNKVDVNFQVFSIQEISDYPNTIARVVSYRPKYRSKDINVGEVCYKLQKSDIYGIVTQIRGRPPKSSQKYHDYKSN